MYFHDRSDRAARASMLIHQLINEHDPRFGVGSLTCSVYDTAWVSMVTKTTEGEIRWLFPSCFAYLLDTQQPDGGWQTTSSDPDGILNTLAALLALCRHIKSPYQLEETAEDLQHRKNRAVYWLETKFSQLQGASLVHSGFETLIPTLLLLLEQENVDFCLLEKERLLELKKRSSSKLMESGNLRLSSLHSLEGLTGEIDFNKVRHHKISGSMMASPASTAAYLMNCSVWDNEAEEYLNHVVAGRDGQAAGGVPSKYPSTVFEMTVLLSTLLENGFTPKDLGLKTLDNAADFLQNRLQLESSVTGSAAYVESDADSTSRAISALCRLGRSASPRGLILRYETREYFKTYTQDRNPSFRTNCLVLKAFLDLLPGKSEQMPQIEKLARFICNSWWTTNGQIEDSCNTSPNYPVMLMAQVFTRLLELWDSGLVPVPSDASIREKVIISLFQALTRLLQTQNPDGSWGRGQRCETTAYAVLTVARLSCLSSAPRVKSQITQSIDSGRHFLLVNFSPFSEADPVWHGKTTSGSSILHQAFVLAALQAPIARPAVSIIDLHFEIPLAKITIQTKYYGRQAAFSTTPEWLVQACLIESHLFIQQIRDVRFAVFPSESLAEDTFFEYIPFMWIVANKLDGRSIGAEFLYQMMILSVLERQFDDYFQNVVGETFEGCIFEVEDIIYGIFRELEINSKDQCFCGSHDTEAARSSTATSISDVRSVLYRFISHILNHPYVLMASVHDQNQLNTEIQSFLLGRINQLSDREKDVLQNDGEDLISDSTAHTDSSIAATDQTSHFYTFAFLSCLVGNQSSNGGVGLRRDFLDTPELRYLSSDLCRRLSIISFLSKNTLDQPTLPSQHIERRSRSTSFRTGRQSFGSISAASTASSVYSNDSYSPVSPVSSVSSAPSDFPEFGGFTKPQSISSYESAPQSPSQSQQLARLLTHERRCLSICLDSLTEAGIDCRTANIITLFVDFTALSEQIYNDPNIGSCYQPTSAYDIFEQHCILDPRSSPPRKNKGSVAAARAAISIPPLTIKHDSRAQSFAESDIRSLTPSQETKSDNRMQPSTQEEKVAALAPAQRDRSWNKKPAIIQNKHTSRATSEVARVEQIMSAIDGPMSQPKRKSETKRKSMGEGEQKPTVTSERRTASEGNADWIPPIPKIDLRTRLSGSKVDVDADAIRLAKLRMQTQRRLSLEAQKKAAFVDAEVQRRVAAELQNKAMAEARMVRGVPDDQKAAFEKQDGKRNASVRPQSPNANFAKQKARLHRASRLGGPRWKAPW